jgi:hypothetical protein
MAVANGQQPWKKSKPHRLNKQVKTKGDKKTHSFLRWKKVEESKRFLSYKIKNTQIKKGDCVGKDAPKKAHPNLNNW